MVIRSTAARLPAAVLFAGLALSGCRHTGRQCDSCNGQWAAAPANPHAVTPGTVSPEIESRAPMPRNHASVPYRETTLLERMRYRLQSLNPLRRIEGPVLEYGVPPRPSPPIQPVPQSNLPYTPAPGVDGTAGRLRGMTTPQDMPWSDFEPARIAPESSEPSASPLSAVNLERWPYGTPPRFLNTDAGDAEPPKDIRVRNFR